MSDSSPPTYTTQDFSAVNDYVEHLAARHQTAISERRANIFGTYAKWFAVLIAAIGVAALLTLWGMSLYKEKPEPRIIEPVVVDRPVPVPLPQGDTRTGSDPEIQRQLESIRSTIASLQTDSPVDPLTTDGANMVIDFVIFKEVGFRRGDLEEVVVGMQFDDSNSEFPSSQWCYVMKPNLSGTGTRVDLANKVGTERIDRIVTAAMGKELGVSISVLMEAQRLCAFE